MIYIVLSTSDVSVDTHPLIMHLYNFVHNVALKN